MLGRKEIEFLATLNLVFKFLRKVQAHADASDSCVKLTSLLIAAENPVPVMDPLL